MRVTVGRARSAAAQQPGGGRQDPSPFRRSEQSNHFHRPAAKFVQTTHLRLFEKLPCCGTGPIALKRGRELGIRSSATAAEPLDLGPHIRTQLPGKGLSGNATRGRRNGGRWKASAGDDLDRNRGARGHQVDPNSVLATSVPELKWLPRPHVLVATLSPITKSGQVR